MAMIKITKSKSDNATGLLVSIDDRPVNFPKNTNEVSGRIPPGTYTVFAMIFRNNASDGEMTGNVVIRQGQTKLNDLLVKGRDQKETGHVFGDITVKEL